MASFQTFCTGPAGPRTMPDAKSALLLPMLLALGLLAGCAAQPPVQAPPPPPGMELVLGQPAETALRLLGTPRLDRREGPARQLQFAGPCILDIFYYPRNGQAPAAGQASGPVATHTEARLPNGVASSPGDCLQLLLKIRPASAG